MKKAIRIDLNCFEKPSLALLAAFRYFSFTHTLTETFSRNIYVWMQIFQRVSFIYVRFCSFLHSQKRIQCTINSSVKSHSSACIAYSFEEWND